MANAANCRFLADSKSAATLERNRVYETEISFWQEAEARNPNNARAANNLGMAYALDCRFEDAIVEFERSIELSPGDYRARVNLILLRKGALPGLEMKRCVG